MEKFPEYKREIEEVDTPMSMWIELHQTLENLYRGEWPHDEEHISRIYAYAEACLSCENDEMVTAVMLAFYENILLHPKVRRDLPNWMNERMFDGLEEVFRYHVEPDNFEKYSKEFHEAKKTPAKEA